MLDADERQFYLTLLFVVPLRNLYSYKHSPNSMLRTIALRSFIGSLGTLTSSVVYVPSSPQPNTP